ncbi:MAG TPA: outer membrane beta-barrel protein [Xanthobacteraceae bacterium]|nr:outer membrane beta-barrel protein [Xanthobacteraceae bacterium]
MAQVDVSQLSGNASGSPSAQISTFDSNDVPAWEPPSPATQPGGAALSLQFAQISMDSSDIPAAVPSPQPTQQSDGDVIGPQIAQLAPIGGGFGTALEASPVVTDRPDVFESPGRANDALVVADWLIHPTTTVGFAYDSNVSQTPSPQGSAGLRLDSSLLAENDNGVWQTKIYYNSDVIHYFRQIPGYGTVLSGRAGVAETFLPLPDFMVNGQLDVMRQQDQFNSLGTEPGIITLNPTGVGIAPTTNPQSYNQLSGNLSVTKNFARTFATIGGAIIDIIYDHSSGGVSSSPSGVTYTGMAKGGFWLTPMIYGYLEGSLDERSYLESVFNSSGHRFLAGAGTDQLGLFKGEIFVGYQAENYTSGVPGVASPVYGLHGYYYPLPELTINLSVDETLGVSTEAPVGMTPGTSTKIASYLTSAQYAIAPEWSATGRAGHITTDYVGSSRHDGAWTAGATVTYNILRNVGLTLDYQWLQLSSNVPDEGFRREIATIGATWRY